MLYRKWPKIPRLENEVYHITEKIDGTNGCIIIQETHDGNERDSWLKDPLTLYGSEGNSEAVRVLAQSRTRIITPEDDNFGFAKWVQDNAEQLIKDLGVGYHYGEWWGQGINRGYGLDHQRFSLFNPTKTSSICSNCLPFRVVDTMILQEEIDYWKNKLIIQGSLTVPGYMKPEGLVIYAEKAKCYWKIILDK